MSYRDTHPWEYVDKVCPGCGEVRSINRRGKHCSRRCAMLGNSRSAGIEGERHASWCGDDITYLGAHLRVYRARGKASAQICKCGAQAKHWANLSGNYPDADDYEAMCVPCHHVYDKERRNQ